MRIPAKVSLGVGALAFVVFGSIAVWQAALERRDLVHAVEQEMMLTGRGMRIATENALRDRQTQDVGPIVSALEEISADVDVLMFAPDGSLRATSEGGLASAERFEPAALVALPAEHPQVDLDEGRAVLILPLSVEGESLGSLAIVRPLSDVREDLRREVGGLALAVAVFAVLVCALAYGLGEVLVGRPLARLSTAMAGVGRGDLHPPLDGERDDEIGRVTASFQAMLAELARARENLELEQDAHRRSTRALQDADRLVTLGQLSAGLAHEIGSPLQVLHGRARRLLRNAEDADEVRRVAEVIVGQAERITRIVRQLLDVARRRPRNTLGEPIAAVRSVVELLELEARRRGVTVELRVQGELPAEAVEVDTLQQIALNLARNALQASHEGGHVVLALGRGKVVHPATAVHVPSLRLEVLDDGAGIDPAIRSQLFEPFFTTRSGDGGTGLGLAIVGTLAKELGGMVTVESELGQGTCFVVELPIGHTRVNEKEAVA